MNIVEFFQQSAGRWSSIKSNHHVDTTQQQSGRSTIEMELLESNDPTVAEICSKQGQDANAITCAAKVKWEGTMEGTTKKTIGSTTIIAVGTAEKGELLRAIGNFGTPAATGSYHFGDGGEFVLTVQEKDFVSNERIWFESENVRMRHTKIQYSDGKSVVSFCSEVRLMSKPKS